MKWGNEKVANIDREIMWHADSYRELKESVDRGEDRQEQKVWHKKYKILRNTYGDFRRDREININS